MEADKGAAQPSEPVLRREPRNPTNWIATIRLSDGEEIPCTVKDVSKSGAKIGVPAYQVLPQTFLLRIIGRDFLCMVKLAWRRGDYVGVRIERVGKVAAPTPAQGQVAAPAQGKVMAPAQGQVAAPPQGKVAAPAQDKAAPVAPPLPVPPITDDSGSVGIRSRRRGLSSF